MITPVEDYKKLSEEYQISLKVKRDDMYLFAGGGNKARKIKPILDDAENKNANALVTAGSAGSNHARVTAIAGAGKGWPVRLIIHDTEDESNSNLMLMTLTGAELIFVEKKDVANSMHQSMEELARNGYHPYAIRGGGHTIAGMMSYYEAAKEFSEQSNGWQPEYVILASGTGGTQAGLHTGFAEHMPATRVIGISVAREKARGKKMVQESVAKLQQHLNVQITNEVCFFDNWTGGGYGMVYPDLQHTIKKAAAMEGLITDPVYTGKALTGLFDMCKNGFIKKGSRVLFWHTGGLINLLNNLSLVR